MMTPRERFIHALERRPPPPGRVPHFELVYFLTMEAFGQVHPAHRNYGTWLQMTERERQLHRLDQARLYIAIAERFEHNAIFIHPHQEGKLDKYREELCRMAELIRELSGDKFFLMCHGDATYGLPTGDTMMDFICQLCEEPQKTKDEAERLLDEALRNQAKMTSCGFDGLALCSDYCFNDNPFMSPDQFAEFVAPYLKRLIQAQRELGFYVIKHTDGNIMPIIDQLVDCHPHALHSLDPQGKIEMAEIKARYGDRICLIGNVNCGLMDTGTDEEVVESARQALRHGMPGGGYIFSTSNCIYTGMRPERYELILDVWRKEGNYP